MSINLLTGQEEGEIDPATGLPRVKDPVAMPNVAPVLDQQTTGMPGGGGSAAPVSVGGITAQSVLPPAAAHEETTTKTLPGAMDIAATKGLDAARLERDNAQAAVDAEKSKQLQIQADEATAKRLNAERESAALKAQDEKVNGLVDRNLKADAQMREDSAAEEKKKLTPAHVRNGLEIFATVLATIGQGFASVTEGSQVWAQGNPVAKMYEKKREAEIARATEEFKASERYRSMKKQGRDAELEAALAELRIGITNRWARDGKVAAAVADEKLAKAGPAAQKAGTALTAGLVHVLDSTADREDAKDYRTKHSVTDRVQPAEDKRQMAGREDIDATVQADTDVAQLEDLRDRIKKDPATFDHVRNTMTNFERGKADEASIGKAPFGIGAAANGVIGLGGEALHSLGVDNKVISGERDRARRYTSADQMLESGKYPDAPAVYTGLQNATAAQARTLGGVVRESDIKFSQALAALPQRTPAEYAKYLDGLIELRRRTSEGMRVVKKGLGDAPARATSPIHDQIRGKFPSAPLPDATPIEAPESNVGFGGTLRSQVNERLNNKRKKDAEKQ